MQYFVFSNPLHCIHSKHQRRLEENRILFEL